MIGVVAALPAEARTLAGRRCPAGRIVGRDAALVVAGGIGAERAARAVHALLERGVEGLVSWGTAGGLARSCRAGDVVIAHAVRRPDGTSLTCDDRWRRALCARLEADPDAAGGVVAESREVVADATAKRSLHERADAIAVDMESGAIGAAALGAGLPFLVIRAVCDEADEVIPRAARGAVREDGRLRPFALLRAIATRPRDLRALLRMASAFGAARTALRTVATRAGPRLAFPADSR